MGRKRDENEKQLLAYLHDEGEITAKTAENLLGLSKSHVNRIFVKLRQDNVILKNGSGRNTYYTLKE